MSKRHVYFRPSYPSTQAPIHALRCDLIRYLQMFFYVSALIFAFAVVLGIVLG